MSAPYRAEAQRFYVRADSSYRRPSDLDGERLGVRASCSVEAYLKGELELPGVRLTRSWSVRRSSPTTSTRPELKDLGRRKLDGYACNENVGKQAIKQGIPIRALDERAFEEYLTGFQASRWCGGDER